ncbi:hypothetical protein D3C78_1242620 [compost metagenome]
MDEIAQAEHGEQHQHQGQLQNGLEEGEEFTFRNARAVGKQQRRNEQQQEQLGVERDVQAFLRPGNQRTEGNLDQGQGDGADISGSDAGQGSEHQYQQDGFYGVHPGIVPRQIWCAPLDGNKNHVCH